MYASGQSNLTKRPDHRRTWTAVRILYNGILLRLRMTCSSRSIYKYCNGPMSETGDIHICLYSWSDGYGRQDWCSIRKRFTKSTGVHNVPKVTKWQCMTRNWRWDGGRFMFVCISVQLCHSATRGRHQRMLNLKIQSKLSLAPSVMTYVKSGRNSIPWVYSCKPNLALILLRICWTTNHYGSLCPTTPRWAQQVGWLVGV